MKFNKPIGFLSAGVVLSFTGLGLALISGAILLEGYASKSWPTTDARIASSEVIVSQKAGGVRRGGLCFCDFYTAKVEYEYTVGEKTFVSDKLAIASVPEGFDRRIAEAAIAKYPAGAKVTVSYNPRDPSSAVIDPTVTVGLWWAGVAFGLAALVAGAVLWLKAIKIDEAQRAAVQIAAAPRPDKVRPKALDAAAAASRPVKTVQVHWLLRTIAVLAGLVFFFLGSLSLVLVANMGAPAGNAAAPQAAALIAQVITMGIVGCITLFGAFLIWIGMKRTIRLMGLRSTPVANHPVQSKTDRSTLTQVPDFGAFVAQCGPQVSGLTNYLVGGAVMLVVAIGCFIAPSILNVKPADEAAVKGFMWLFGGLSAVCGFGMMWKPLFGQNQVILLYERGLIERVGPTSYAIALEEIEQLRVQEWYDHRFAPLTFNVQAKVRGEKELAFSSALRGDSKRIIAYLAERVAHTEMVPFEANLRGV